MKYWWIGSVHTTVDCARYTRPKNLYRIDRYFADILNNFYVINPNVAILPLKLLLKFGCLSIYKL